MDLALITYNGWYAIKPNQTKIKPLTFPNYQLSSIITVLLQGRI